MSNSSERQEVELKLEFDSADLPVILNHPLLATDSKRETLRSTYYDTPDLVLREAGVSLRVRDTDGRLVQTIKSASDNAGIFNRSEWEHDIARYGFDLIAARETALEPLLSVRVRNSLRPMFETRVERTVYQLKRNGSVIEVALDTGGVEAGGRRIAIHELEFELKRGSAAELFRLARELYETVPLRMTGRAKAERGYDLIDDANTSFEKARPLQLDQGISVEKAFRAIAHSCLRQILANEPGVRAGNGDALHQMRIGLRRLRTAIVIFAKFFTKADQATLRDNLKWATNQLGPARDFDVLAADVLKYLSENDSGEKEVEEARRDFTLKRAEKYATARAFLLSKRFRRTLLDVAEWVETPSWIKNPSGPDTQKAVEAHAAMGLAKRRKQVRKQGRKLRELDAASRHELRIRAKKLRYTIELFDGLFSGEKNAERREAALKSLKQLQDALGTLNDIAVRTEALDSNGDGLGAHAAAMLKAGDANTGALIEQAEKAHREFSSVKTFWKDGNSKKSR